MVCVRKEQHVPPLYTIIECMCRQTQISELCHRQQPVLLQYDGILAFCAGIKVLVVCQSFELWYEGFSVDRHAKTSFRLYDMQISHSIASQKPLGCRRSLR